MAQADQTVQNATFPTVRADINNNLAALFSDSSGNGAPTVTVAFQDWIDTSGADAVWKKRNAANNAWITIGTFAGAGLSLGGAVPAGSIQYFAGSSAPDGYLKANGALISRTTYADLFTAIGTTFGVGDGSTTFAVPDLRGADELKSHTHTYVNNGTGFDNPNNITGSRYNLYGNSQTTGSTGGTETRPRNIALLACIKF